MVSEQGWSIGGGNDTYETEEEKRSALSRAKGRATGLLVLAGAVFFFSLNLETQFPWLGYAKAFSEAAMVGALADWFAVVALFRHPLGVPIPHTNIIVKKVEESESHELRKEFDRKVEEFIFNLRNSREHRKAVEDIKDRILESEEVSEYVRNLWDKLKLWVQEDSETPKSVVRERVSQWMIKWGQRIRTEEKMRFKVNDIIIEVARKIVGNTKDKVSDFIYKNVSEWNPEELVGKIELNIGKDLQMIRINGTLVGGTVGVLLYSISNFILFF